MRKVIALIRRTIEEFLGDNCAHLAAAISFYILLALFPLTLAAISIAGFVLRSPETEAKAIEGIVNLFPVSREFIESSIKAVVRARGATGIAATIGLVWLGSPVFNALRKSLNVAWGIRQPRRFIRDRLVELSMMAGVGFLFLLSLYLTTALKVRLPLLGAEPLSGNLLWNFITAVSTTAITFVTFAFLYKFVPNAPIRWRDVWIGALFAAVAFEIAKNAFVLYVSNFATYNIVYGSIGVLVALLTWIYISAVVFLFGAKLASVCSGVTPPETLPLQQEEIPNKGQRRISPRLKIFIGLATLGAIGVSAFKRLKTKKGE